MIQENSVNPDIGNLKNAVPAITSLPDLRSFCAQQRQEGRSMALVPTMGALHEGHLSLVTQALEQADTCIVSIFVNPTQFGPHEDFDKYPRMLSADLEKLADAGAHAVWAPPVGVMYPAGFDTVIRVGGVSEPLEGEHRPGHFEGVATVVAKLLSQVQPDVAIFGEKDYQQLQVIRRMAADLDLPVSISGAPTMRDENGLALSSRNAYLSSDEYRIAINLNKALFAMAQMVASGDVIADIEKWGKAQLEKAGFERVDYIAIRDAQTLAPVEEKAGRSLRILAAVKIGATRLIDNVAA